MYDYNAELSAVDGAMSMLEDYRKELHDCRAGVAFALTDLMQAVDHAVYCCTRELEEVRQTDDRDSGQSTTHRLQVCLPDLQDLQYRCTRTATALLDGWNARCAACDRLSEDGFADTGRYLQKLNRVAGLSASSSPAARTVVLDSARYPQTAEHIRAAQNRGLPNVLTLSRPDASERRSASLAHKPARSDFDRDEYPCAMFAEGGKGADVAYIDGSDNRGAGAALQWQLRELPDGTKIRIRVI